MKRPVRPRRVGSLLRSAAGVCVLAVALSGCSLLAGSSPGPNLSAGRPDAGSTAAATGATGGTTSTTTPPSTTDLAVQVDHAVHDLVRQRANAVATKDKAAWLGSVADAGNAFGSAQGDLFDRILALPLTGLTASDVAMVGPSGDTSTGATDPWVANLHLAYRFAGYDRGDRTFSASYTVADTPDGWRLSGTGPGTTDAQPFDLAGLNTVRSPSTLVIGDLPTATLQTYLTVADTAHGRIEEVWGQALPGVVVAPKSTDELQAQLGGGYAGLGQVAGITTGPLPQGVPASNDRVYLNPDILSKVTSAGRRVVITHELTHVTVRGTTDRRVPVWLSEGFADDVAFAPLGLPPKTVAPDLVAEIRKGAGPTALPTSDDFDPARGSIDPAYNEAWLAVSRMRQRYGQDRVVAFYRAIAGGPTVDHDVSGRTDELTERAFTDVLGTTQAQFVDDWLAYLAQLAR